MLTKPNLLRNSAKPGKITENVNGIYLYSIACQIYIIIYLFYNIYYSITCPGNDYMRLTKYEKDRVI